MTITELYEFIATNARRVYTRDHHHMPMFFIDFHEPTDFLNKGQKTDFAIMPVMWETVDDRERLSIMMKTLCGLGIVRNIGFVHEVWMVRGGPGNPVDTKTPPSENPDRTSVLMLNVEASTGEARRGFWPVINADTRKARLGEFEDFSGGEGEGRFANFFEHARKAS